MKRTKKRIEDPFFDYVKSKRIEKLSSSTGFVRSGCKRFSRGGSYKRCLPAIEAVELESGRTERGSKGGGRA